MKKFKIVLFALIIGLSSCAKEKSKYQQAIKANILEHAEGIDLKAEFDSIVFVNKYTTSDVTKFWINKELKGIGNIDTLISQFKDIDNLKKNSSYKWFKWQQNRFTELKLKGVNEVLYEVVKAFYKIEMPFFKTKTSVLNYYVIQNSKVIGMISEFDMQDAVSKSLDPILTWEFIQYKNLKPALP